MSGFDRMGKDTGPGKVAVDMTPGQDIVCSHVLFNYNVDGNVMKPEHKKFLEDRIVPLLRAHRVHTHLVGTASKSGDAEYNRQLSLSRVLRVKQFLASFGIPESKLPGSAIFAAGEDLSTSKINEDELDRAVRISIRFGIRPLPIYPKIVIPVLIVADGPQPVPPPPPNQQDWTIRQIFGQNFGVGAGVGVPGVGIGITAGPVQYSFLLVNRKTQQMSVCTYAGGAASGGVGPNSGWGVGLNLGMSMTMQSKTWDNFSTKSDVKIEDFEGTAGWHEPASLGGVTDISMPAQLTLPHLGITIPVTTGHTVGFPGALMSVGRFTCQAPVQLKL